MKRENIKKVKQLDRELKTLERFKEVLVTSHPDALRIKAETYGPPVVLDSGTLDYGSFDRIASKLADAIDEEIERKEKELENL